MSHECTNCKKLYKSPQSLWNHKNKYHQIINFKVETNTISQLSVLKSKMYNNESNSYLTNYDKQFIMDTGLEYLIYLIKINDFTSVIPKKYDYNKETIFNNDKCEIFDMVLVDNLFKLENLSTDICFTSEEKQDYIRVIERIKHVLFTSKRAIKKYYNEVNQKKTNTNKNINKIWENLINLKDIVDELKNNKIQHNSSLDSDTSSDDEVSTAKLINFKKKFVDTQKVSTNQTNKTNTIKIKDKEYFIDGFNVYIKNPDNSRGELYGAYLNGKIKKHFTPKDNEIEL